VRPVKRHELPQVGQKWRLLHVSAPNSRASDHSARRRAQQQELDIVDTTGAVHGPVAIPYTFLLDRDLSIYKIYNGWWYVGRPTAEEIRMDFRALLSRRADWWYDKTPSPYAAGASHT